MLSVLIVNVTGRRVRLAVVRPRCRSWAIVAAACCALVCMRPRPIVGAAIMMAIAAITITTSSSRSVKPGRRACAQQRDTVAPDWFFSGPRRVEQPGQQDRPNHLNAALSRATDVEIHASRNRIAAQ